MTVTELVARALRLLRVIDPNQAVKPHDMATALVALNAMARRWEANGVALGWTPVSNPSDTVPVPPEAEEAIAYGLAMTLRPEYGVPIEPDVVAVARQSYTLLQRDQIVANPIAWDCGGYGYNTYTDGPGWTVR